MMAKTFDESESDIRHLVRMRAAGHVFAVAVDSVTDVLQHFDITPIPTAPTEVIGAMNLRGRIVTVIDLKTRLGLQSDADQNKKAGLVVEHEGELYCLRVDSVQEVMNVPEDDIQPAPQHLSQDWLEVASGVYPMGDELVVVLESHLLLSSEK